MTQREQAPGAAEAGSEDADMARVLLAAGQRPQPPAEMTRAVHAAVREEWRLLVEKRSRQRRWAAFAAAASVAALALALWAAGPLRAAPGPAVASVVRANGATVRVAGIGFRSHAVREGRALHSGDVLATDRGGHMALALADGTSVRIDSDTQAELAAADRIVLSRGALYVDAGSSGGQSRLEIGTPFLSVRHLGTRYEVRILPKQVQVSVRDGRVRVQPATGHALEGDAGERLLISGSGEVERSQVAPYDSQWSWTAQAAPPFEIDGQPLAAYLEWAGHELGRPVVFSSPQARATAEHVLLSGSASGLTVTEALTAVLSTTSLRSRERDGALVIEAAATH